MTWGSQAFARAVDADDDDPPAAESVEILVVGKGRYMRYLPRIYQEQDELMGRFVMLFESFWAPIESQIDVMPLYFDPALTPLKLLPWLATWVDLALDDHWPEAKRRQLLKAAVGLYRKRGTRRGLQEYLEIYTGAQVQISEHGAHNFLLGPEARLGPGVALGTLVGLYVSCKKGGSTLKLIHLSERVKELLKLTQLASIFEGRSEYLGMTPD